MHHLVNPGFLLGFGNLPHPLNPTIYEKDTKKSTTPQKKLNHSGIFSMNPPQDSAPHRRLPPGGSRSRRAWRQNTPPQPGHNLQPGSHKLGKTKTNMFFAPKKWGKKHLFSNDGERLVEGFGNYGFNRLLGGLYIYIIYIYCAQPLGFRWVFCFVWQPTMKNTWKHFPGKPGVSTQTHATRFPPQRNTRIKTPLINRNWQKKTQMLLHLPTLSRKKT